MVNLDTALSSEIGEIVHYQSPEMVEGKKGKKVEQLVKKVLDLRKVLRECMLADLGPAYKTPKLAKARYDLFRRMSGRENITFTRKEKKLIFDALPWKFDVIVSGQVINLINHT